MDVYPAGRLTREYAFVDAETAACKRGRRADQLGRRPPRGIERRPGGNDRLRPADHRGTVVHTRDAGGGDGFGDIDFLDESFGWHSIGDTGFPLIANVHVGERLANAFPPTHWRWLTSR